VTDIRQDETFEPKGRFVRAEAADKEPTPTRRFERADATIEEAATRAPRPRHEVPRGVRLLLRPFFRYSYTRDAWVLHGVGSKRGPVIRNL
jgi:hypothetical protein